MAAMLDTRNSSPSIPILAPLSSDDMGHSTPIQSPSSSPAPDNSSHSSTSPPPRQPDYDMTGHGSPHTVPLPPLSPWSSYPGSPSLLPSSPKYPRLSPLLLPVTSPRYSGPGAAQSSPTLPALYESPLAENSSLEVEIVPPSPSFASFASDRDEYSSGDDGGGHKFEREEQNSPSSELSELEKELLQVKSPPRVKATRTPLPDFRRSCSVSPSVSNHDGEVRSSPSNHRVARRGSRWTADDLVMLKHLREEKHLQWAEVSKLMPGRTALACNRYYNKTKLTANRSCGASSADGAAGESSAVNKAKMTRWKLEEIRKLRKLKAAGTSWKDIATQMPGRTIGACRRKKELTRMEIEANLPSSGGEASDNEELQDGGSEKHDAHEEMEECDDGETSDDGNVQERGARSIMESETFPTGPNPSSNERPRIDIVDRVLKGEGESEEAEMFESAITDADEVVESCMVDASDSSSSGDESSSESNFEDESKVRRMHETFFKNR